MHLYLFPVPWQIHHTKPAQGRAPSRSVLDPDMYWCGRGPSHSVLDRDGRGPSHSVLDRDGYWCGRGPSHSEVSWSKCWYGKVS